MIPADQKPSYQELERTLATYQAEMPEAPEWLQQLRLAVSAHNWNDIGVDHSKIEKVKQWLDLYDALAKRCARQAVELEAVRKDADERWRAFYMARGFINDNS